MIHKVIPALAFPKKQVSLKVKDAAIVYEAESLEFLAHILRIHKLTRQGDEICISNHAISSNARKGKF
jgi:hypothetical protein